MGWPRSSRYCLGMGACKGGHCRLGCQLENYPLPKREIQALLWDGCLQRWGGALASLLKAVAVACFNHPSSWHAGPTCTSGGAVQAAPSQVPAAEGPSNAPPCACRRRLPGAPGSRCCQGCWHHCPALQRPAGGCELLAARRLQVAAAVAAAAAATAAAAAHLLSAAHERAADRCCMPCGPPQLPAAVPGRWRPAAAPLGDRWAGCAASGCRRGPGRSRCVCTAECGTGSHWSCCFGRFSPSTGVLSSCG